MPAVRVRLGFQPLIVVEKIMRFQMLSNLTVVVNGAKNY